LNCNDNFSHVDIYMASLNCLFDPLNFLLFKAAVFIQEIRLDYFLICPIVDKIHSQCAILGRGSSCSDIKKARDVDQLKVSRNSLDRIVFTFYL
jgi:hypothetical protein